MSIYLQVQIVIFLLWALGTACLIFILYLIKTMIEDAEEDR